MKQLKALEILKFMKMSSSSNITILNEAIAELEALENRSCVNCNYANIIEFNNQEYVAVTFELKCKKNIVRDNRPEIFNCSEYKTKE